MLVVKKAVLQNKVPSVPGGGTVSYVTADHHRYTVDPVRREEGGTPAIIESIRAGLVFQLKDAVGVETIHRREADFIRLAIDRWSENPSIRILGKKDAWRLSIVSFQVRAGERWLHHNYVVALLNDLFGIHARGGCSCAGPYGHRLLGIDPALSQAYEDESALGWNSIKPGWVRVNFNYFISEETFQYLLGAVDLVATHGCECWPSTAATHARTCGSTAAGARPTPCA